jgi:hypothetical protein
MEITLLSTSMPFWKILILAFIAIGLCTRQMMKEADRGSHADENMQMLAIFAFPHSAFWLSSAIALIAVTVILGIIISVSSWDRVREHFNFKTK